MKSVILQTLLFTGLFLLISCENKITCQREFFFVNNSQDSVVIGDVMQDGFGNCILSGWHNTIPPGGKVRNDKRGCLESSFENKNLEFYVIDPDDFKKQEDFYPCDSVEIKNSILRKYSLSSDELKSMNWTITYP